MWVFYHDAARPANPERLLRNNDTFSGARAGIVALVQRTGSTLARSPPRLTVDGDECEVRPLLRRRHRFAGFTGSNRLPILAGDDTIVATQARRTRRGRSRATGPARFGQERLLGQPLLGSDRPPAVTRDRGPGVCEPHHLPSGALRRMGGLLVDSQPHTIFCSAGPGAGALGLGCFRWGRISSALTSSASLSAHIEIPCR
jgi:hypothetical protein